jgi:calcineurin-like phosphoesterase family protein
MTRTWFTADTHFGHRLLATKRGFETIKEHDRALIELWNAVVGDGDDVWHLGDFAVGSSRGYAQGILNELHGFKRLVLGNHDGHGHGGELYGWVTPPSMREIITLDGQTIVLDHYAGRVWHKSHQGSIQLYGHSHGRLPGTSQSTDVGVDCWGLAPAEWQAILARLASTRAAPEVEGMS